MPQRAGLQFLPDSGLSPKIVKNQRVKLSFRSTGATGHLDNRGGVSASVVAQLREATSGIHQQIDSDPQLAAYLQSSSGVAYLLGRWYGFLSPFEEALSRHAQDLSPLIAARKRTQYLQNDLKFHGVDVGRLPMFAGIPRFNDQVEMLGCMYVTEGSTLGGLMIARQIEALQGCAGSAGHTFFSAYGEQTGSRWKEFTQTVEKVCSRAPEVAVTSAVTTFISVHKWLLAKI